MGNLSTQKFHFPTNWSKVGWQHFSGCVSFITSWIFLNWRLVEATQRLVPLEEGEER